ncbi:MAG: hypothetical protein L6Q71_01260, partial [Planctomycetes bacterium]|nr:hypothetical protein [Planctomycetota bacterium]
MSESLYGPSPAFLRAVRWFSRGLYLFMGIAVIAAFAYANGESNENEKLRRDKRDLEGRVAALEQGLDGLQYSRASGGSDGAALHRQIETLNGELAAKDQEIADLNQRLIDERMRADTAGIEAQHSLSRLDELERKIRLLTEERDVLLRAGATQPKPAEGAQPAAPEKLDAAFQRLHENEKDTAVRLSVIDAMRGVDDDTCVVAIRKNAKTLLPETILMLIEGRRPVGGDELATELFRLPGGEQL